MMRALAGARARGTAAIVVILAPVLAASCGTRGPRTLAPNVGFTHRAEGIRQSTSGCIPYKTTGIPAGTRCMIMPWVLAEAGPGARSVYITLARGCFGGYPTTRVVQTTAAIRIRAFAWHPGIRHGRLDMTCGGGSTEVELRSPIDGRRIEGESARGRLRYDSAFPLPPPYGLPRLLGLSPAEAIHTLSLYGFRAQLSGTGPEIVAQVPGWGLFGPRRLSPVRYPGVTKLVAGNRIEIPTKPALPPDAGAPSGILSGAIRFEGGPGGYRRPVAGVVALFDARGKILARFAVRARNYFHLRLTPGRYVLLADNEGWIFCGPSVANVHRGQVERVTVGTGCGVP